ncbi:MAG: phosphate acyltransferase PlsX [Phycisphaerae bacterium]
MRIGIDAMGGDNAPTEEVRGALAARELLNDGDRIVLVGDQGRIEAELRTSDGWDEFITIAHAPEQIDMDEKPVEALRAKPDSSLNVLMQMHKRGEVDAVISSGNTGATVAAAQMRLRRLRGVHRPGIAIITPTTNGPVALSDVGANILCKPQHLHQYAVMSSIYVQVVAGISNPRVGLLSVGEEDAKGNELVKESRQLMKNDENLNFIGNLEGRDLFRGVCDVLVCDGFVGNVILKLMEGMAGSVVKAILKELISHMPQNVDKIMAATGSLISKYDFNEYGGAPLLGVDGICIICHGATDQTGIKNAVRSAYELIDQNMNDRISNLLLQS